MIDRRPIPEPEAPRAEPEIIPPDRARGRRTSEEARIWVSVAGRSGRRVYFAKPGPLAMILTLLLLGIIAAAAAIILLGAFLIWVPVVVVLAIALVLSGLVRGYFRRL